MKYKILSCIAIFIFMISLIHSQVNSEIIIGHKSNFYSKILSEEREYWISLPTSYHAAHQSDKKYPILILLDGDTHFHSISGMVNTMSSGNTDKMEIPEMIVVALLNVNRERDFTPEKVITKRKNQTGGGDLFLAFLEKELIPKVESQYRTEPYRLLVGHSLGGLITTHAYMQEKSPFNSYISIDPSFGTWDESIINEKIAKTTAEVFNRPFYLATANWDKRNSKNRVRHNHFYKALKTNSKNTCNAKHKYYADKNHSSVPFIAIYEGLLHIFEGFNPTSR